MGNHGWISWMLTLGDSEITISLSSWDHDPFDDLLSWGWRIDTGRLPARLNIDEEGEIVILNAVQTIFRDRILLQIEYLDDEIPVLTATGISRSALAKALKLELRRFFTDEFDQNHWDFRLIEEFPAYIPTRQRVLQHPWICTEPPH